LAVDVSKIDMSYSINSELDEDLRAELNYRAMLELVDK